MNKKRALALFLAMAMAIPSNLTAFAASDSGFVPSMTAEETVETEESTEANPEDTETTQPEDIDKSEDNPGESNLDSPSEEPDGSEGTDDKEEPDKIQDEGAGEEEPTVKPGEGDLTEEPSEEEIVIEEEEDLVDAKAVVVEGEQAWKNYFVNDTSVTTLTLKTEATKLPETVVIPKHITTIPSGIFTDKQDKVRRIVFEEGIGNLTIAPEAFIRRVANDKGSTIYSSKVQYIDDLPVTELVGKAFYGARNLKGVTFEDITALTSIGESAFEGSGIQEMDLSAASSLTSIEERAFARCTSLRSVYWPLGASAPTTVAKSAFAGCTGLKNVYLGTKVTTIGANAFDGCTGLERITLPENVASIQAGAFAGCGLTEVVIRQRGTDAASDNPSTITLDPTAFPKRSMTMKGYDGTVKEYAADRGYAFVSLYPRYSVSVKSNDKELGIIETSHERARPGEIVEVRVLLEDEACRFLQDSVTLNGSHIESVYEGKLIRTTAEGGAIYTFEMPKADVVVKAEFVDESTSGLTKPRVNISETLQKAGVKFTEKLVADKNSNGSYRGTNSLEYHLQFTKAGQYVPLSLYTNGRKIGKWDVTYSVSSNASNVVSVTQDGTIRSLGYGYDEKNGVHQPKTYYIDAKPKDGSKAVRIYVTVKNNIPDADKGSAYVNPQNVDGEFEFTAREFDTEIIKDKYDTDKYQYIRFKKSDVALQSRSFDVNLKVTEGDAEIMPFEVAWKSADTSLASVQYGTTTDNNNKVTIKKGAEGEVAITAIIKTKQYETDAKGRDKITLAETKKTFVIEVVDDTPRLLEDNIEIYTFDSENITEKINTAKFTLLPVYEKEMGSLPASNELHIKTLEMVNGDKQYKEVKWLHVSAKADNVYTITADYYTGEKDKRGNPVKVKAATYTKNLYITNEDESIVIQIPKLKVTEKMTTPAYALKSTKGIMPDDAKNQTFTLQLIDKKTKAEIMSLGADVKMTITASGKGAGNVTSGLSSEPIAASATPAVTMSSPETCKIMVKYECEYWSKPLTLTYNISKARLAQPKFKTTKVTLQGNVNEAGEIILDTTACTAQGVTLTGVNVTGSNNISAEYTAGKITVKVTSPLTANQTINITPTARISGSSNDINLKSVKVTIAKATVGKQRVTAKVVGNLNVLDPTGTVKIVPTFTNMGNVLAESNGMTLKAATGRNSVDYTGYFALAPDGTLTMTDLGKEKIEANKTYELQVEYKNAGEVKATTANLKIKAVSAQPKLTLPKNTFVMYAGQRYGTKTQTVMVVNPVPGAKIVDYKWSSRTSADIQDAFMISKAADSENLVITLVQPGKLKLNVIRTLQVIPVYEVQQAKNEDGSINEVQTTKNVMRNSVISVKINLKK